MPKPVKSTTDLLKNQLPLFSTAVMHGTTGPSRLREIQNQIQGCQECNLCQTRRSAICGTGNALRPVLAIVSGAPEVTSDLSGAPLVGRPGEVLDQILNWMGLPREDQYLCHVVSCAPGNIEINRHHVSACRPLVYAQLRAVLPQYIVTFGVDAARSVKYEPKKTDKQVEAGYGIWGVFDTTPVMSTHSLESMLGSSWRAKKGEAHEHLRRVIRKLRDTGVLPQKEVE